MSPEQLNAQLFLRLAEFVVWADRHKEITAGDADLARLRERCDAVLATRIVSETRRIAA